MTQITQPLVQQMWTPISQIQSNFVANGVLTHAVIFLETLVVFVPYILIHTFWHSSPSILKYKVHKNKPLTRSEMVRKLKIWVWEHSRSFVVAPVLNWLLLSKVTRSVDALPNIFTLIWQIGFIIFVEETMFYWIHRLMHRIPWLMQNFHQQHHTEQYTDFLSTRIFHTVDDLFGNYVPIIAGTVILSQFTTVHLFTYWLWMQIMMFETTVAHSGFDFPWSIVDGKPHAFHHSHYRDNYGSFFLIWDKLLGTNDAYLKHLEKKKQKKSQTD